MTIVYCRHSSCVVDTLQELSFLLRGRARVERLKIYNQTLTGQVRCRKQPRDQHIPFAQEKLI